ncbi:MAG: excalibur calcium-binding domain-containing protein [Firmicutes bacterium]|nr:excalibur calcium-binding domain-containing protein [Bacillota bacterium]
MKAFPSIAITALFIATAGLMVASCSQGQQGEPPLENTAQESGTFPQQTFQSAKPPSPSFVWQLPQTETVEPEFPPINTWQPPTFSQPSPPPWNNPPLPQFHTPEMGGFAEPSEPLPSVVPQINDPLPPPPSVTPTWPSIPSPSYSSTLPSLQSDYDCADFSSQSEAQMIFDLSGPGDPYQLDSDHDGQACEDLP